MGFDPREVTRAEIREVLAGPCQPEMRALQILHAALMMGIVLYSAVTVLLTFTLHARPQGDGAEAQVRIFTIVNAVLATSMFVIALVVPTKLLREQVHAAAGDAGSAQDFVAAAHAPLRGVWILRHAMIEGAALFGVTICFLASSFGVLGAHPAYYANLATPALGVAWFALMFPTNDRIAGAIQSHAAGTGNVFWV